MSTSVSSLSKRRSTRSVSRNRTRSSLKKEASFSFSLNSNAKSTERKNLGRRLPRRPWSRSSSPRRGCRADCLTTAWANQPNKQPHVCASKIPHRRRKKISTEEERTARLKSIISKLGLIPGERATEFAEAYDSISWLHGACKKIGLSPPCSPPKVDKFNLMPRPERFSKAMKSMTVLNKYGEDILNGTRKNCGLGCNLDANYEKLLVLSKPSTSSTYAGIPISEKDLCPIPKKVPQMSKKRIRNAALLSSGIRLDSVYNRKCREHQRSDREGLCTQPKSTNTCEHCVGLPHGAKEGQVLAGHNRFSTPVADRILKLARFHITGSAQHKSTNTEPTLNSPPYGRPTSDNDNLPIFFKYYRVSPKPIVVSPSHRLIKGYNC